MYSLKAGTTDVSVVIRILDDTDGTPETGVLFNTASIDLQYRREGAASVAITEADLATPALTDAHADGGFLHIGNGYYRLDLPDAACATGVAGVLVHGVVPDMVVVGCYIQLTTVGLADLATSAALATVDGIVDDILEDTGTTLPATLSTIDGRIDTEVAAILADTNELQTDWADGGRLDLILDARASQTSVDTVDQNVDAILVDTAEIGTAGAGLTAIVWNADWDAEVQSEVTDALNAYDPPTHTELTTAVDALPTAAENADAVWTEALTDHEGTSGSTAEALADAGGSGASASDIADAVLDEALSGHTTAGTLGKAIADIEADATLILEDTGTTIPGTITTVDTVVDGIATSVADLPTNAELTTALGSADDATLAAIAALNNLSSAQAQTAAAAALTAYDPPTHTELTTALGNLNDLSAAEVNAEVDTALSDYDAPTKAELDSGLAALNDLSAADVNAEVDTAISDAALATAANLATVDQNVDSILADTGTDGVIVASLAAGAITAAAIATGAVDADALAADAVTEIVTGVLTTAITEAYASVNAAPTISQALLLIQQQLGDFAISGTTLTVRKLDGTTAATFTLDDDTTPTAIARTT